MGYLPDRLRTALDASCAVGTWEWDLIRGCIVHDAGAAQLRTGDAALADQKIFGIESIVAVHPADHDWLIEHVQLALRRGGLMLAEYRVVADDGTVHWLLIRSRTYHDPTGHPVCSQGIIDITKVQGTGERYVVSDSLTPEEPLERAADTAIARKRMLGDGATSEVRASVDLLLLSLGHPIARSSGAH